MSKREKKCRITVKNWKFQKIQVLFLLTSHCRQWAFLHKCYNLYLYQFYSFWEWTGSCDAVFIALIMQYFSAGVMKDRLRISWMGDFYNGSYPTHENMQYSTILLKDAVMSTRYSSNKAFLLFFSQVIQYVQQCRGFNILNILLNWVFYHILTTATQYGSLWKKLKNICHNKKTRHCKTCTQTHAHKSSSRKSPDAVSASQTTFLHNH